MGKRKEDLNRADPVQFSKDLQKRQSGEDGHDWTEK